ncbi:holliday junction resolvase GEN1/YEN1, partial [Phenoliferia sp. Uapishka_3]
MTVAGLWSLLHPAQTTAPFLQLSIDTFSTSPHRGYRVGIDATQWLYHAHCAKQADRFKADADLRVLFYRLCDLLKQGVLALFVFDGPQRPEFKRGKAVFLGQSDLQHTFIRLISAFGMLSRVARGEGEAELAALAQLGELDAVMTDDADTLVFGAPLVIRNPPSKATRTRRQALPSTSTSSSTGSTSSTSSLPLARRLSQLPAPNYVHLYHRDRILTHSHLNRAGMILVALLSGGDYHPEGIKGCGAGCAQALARAGLGEDLLEGFQTWRDDPPRLADFLSEWRERAATELAENTGGFSRQRHYRVAKRMRSASALDFPFLLPLVDAYTSPEVNPFTPLNWSHPVNLQSIITICSSQFKWPLPTLTDNLQRHLWPGLLVRELWVEALRRDLGFAGPSINSVILQSTNVFSSKTAPSTGSARCYRVQLDRRPFEALINPHLPNPDPHSHLPISKSAKKAILKRSQGLTAGLRHWIPAEFLRAGFGWATEIKPGGSGGDGENSLGANKRGRKGKGKERMGVEIDSSSDSDSNSASSSDVQMEDFQPSWSRKSTKDGTYWETLEI